MSVEVEETCSVNTLRQRFESKSPSPCPPSPSPRPESHDGSSSPPPLKRVPSSSSPPQQFRRSHPGGTNSQPISPIARRKLSADLTQHRCLMTSPIGGRLGGGVVLRTPAANFRDVLADIQMRRRTRNFDNDGGGEQPSNNHHHHRRLSNNMVWLAERERLIEEVVKAKKQIKVLSEEAKGWEKQEEGLKRTIDKLQKELGMVFSSRVSEDGMKRWKPVQPVLHDIVRQTPCQEFIEDPFEIISMFIESEHLYLNNLNALSTYYQKPLMTLASYKPELISVLQIETIFLNCSELLFLHRSLYDTLSQLSHLPQKMKMDAFFSVLERTFPSFALYSPFLNTNRMSSMQKEIKSCEQKQHVKLLLQHCQEQCYGKTLVEFLNLPSERFQEYVTLLKHFLNPRMRDVSDLAVKRAEALARFLSNLKYDLLEEKSEWNQNMEKLKLLQKMVPDAPIPLEIFEGNVHLVKQGSLRLVIDGKEKNYFCFLFNRYVAIADRGSDGTHFRILEDKLTPLRGAQLHKSVDIEGQVLQPDLQSGLIEDRLAFRVSFPNSEGLFLRVAKPNELRSWVECFEKCIQESQQEANEMTASEDTDSACFFPLDVGPKIAAASLEKLFQQLTNPHLFQEDFIDVFLLTYPCFTTSKNVLTALLNCIQGSKFDDSQSDTISQTSENSVFAFGMEGLDSGRVSSMSHRTSSCVLSSESEADSPASSPSLRHKEQKQVVVYPRRLAMEQDRDQENEGDVKNRPTSSDRSSSSSSQVVRNSTSDSDISPHTSAFVGDNSVPIDTQNGWTNVEMTLGVSTKALSQTTLQVPTNNANSTSSNYVTFIRRGEGRHERHSSEQSWGDEDSDFGGQSAPVESYLSSISQNPIVKPSDRQMMMVSLNRDASKISSSGSYSYEGGEPGTDEENTLKASEYNYQTELDSCSQMLQNELDQLCQLQLSASASADSFLDPEEPEEEDGRVVGRPSLRNKSETLSNSTRGKVVSVAISEPDLTTIGVGVGGKPAKNSPKNMGKKKVGLPSKSSTFTTSYSSSNTPYGSPYHRTHTSASLSNSSDLLSSWQVISTSSPYGGSCGITPVLETCPIDERSIMKRSGRFSNRMFKRRERDRGSTSSTPPRSGGGIAIKKSATMVFETDKSPSHKSLKGQFRDFTRRVGKKFSRSGAQQDMLNSSADGLESSMHVRKSSTSVQRSHTFHSPTSDGLELGGASRKPSVGSNFGKRHSLVSKVFSILVFWLDNYFEDFDSDDDLRKTLAEFLHSAMKFSPDSQEGKLARKIMEMLHKHVKYPNTLPELLMRTTNVAPETLEKYNWNSPGQLLSEGRELDLGKSSTKDASFVRTLAEQMTLTEFSAYAAVQRSELLNCSWKKSDKEKIAPNLCRLIRRTNEITSWVCSEILLKDTPSARANVIELFVDVARTCLKHNDMHCTLNITIALCSSSIRGLTKTWSHVDKRAQQQLQKLKDATDYKGRCKRMRERLEQLTLESLQKTKELPCALPYIGAYLDQIYSLEMNTKTYNTDNLVNFKKMTNLSELVRTVLQYQERPYTFELVPDIVAYITGAKRLSENELYEVSTKLKE